jgi:hypothetical protein
LLSSAKEEVMSRTYKDRPTWVRARDPKELSSEDHDHYLFGRPIRAHRIVRDEDGEIVYKSVNLHSYVRRAVETHITDDEGNILRTLISYKYVFEEEERNVKQYEIVVIGYYADYCVLPRKGYYSWRSPIEEDNTVFAPCHVWLRTWKYNRPTPFEKKNYHSSQRKTKKLALNRAKKYYNTVGAIDPLDDDYYDDDLNGRNRFHYGWWH